MGMSRGHLSRGSIILGGNCPGTIIWGQFFLRGVVPGVIVRGAINLGGNCPVGVCAGDNCPR